MTALKKERETNGKPKGQRQSWFVFWGGDPARAFSCLPYETDHSRIANTGMLLVNLQWTPRPPQNEWLIVLQVTLPRTQDRVSVKSHCQLQRVASRDMNSATQGQAQPAGLTRVHHLTKSAYQWKVRPTNTREAYCHEDLGRAIENVCCKILDGWKHGCPPDTPWEPSLQQVIQDDLLLTEPRWGSQVQML